MSPLSVVVVGATTTERGHDKTISPHHSAWLNFARDLYTRQAYVMAISSPFVSSSSSSSSSSPLYIYFLKTKQTSGRTLYAGSILDLGSGPCRETFYLYTDQPRKRQYFFFKSTNRVNFYSILYFLVNRSGGGIPLDYISSFFFHIIKFYFSFDSLL
jgi:hypothetical protein